MKKRFLSILLVLTLVMGIMPFSAINVSAADASHTVDASMAASRTNTLINSLVGKYFTTTQATCGNNICDKCKNSNVIGTTWLKNTMGLVPDSVSLLPEHYYSSTGCVTSTAWSCAGFANYCLWYIYAQNPSDNVRRVNIYTGAINKSNMDGSGVRTGDVIRVDDHHSFVYISHDSSGVTVLDSNWDTSRHNLVQKHVISWSWRSGTTMAITRGKNWGTGTHTHSYSGSHYESAHPHRIYQQCSCGATKYTGSYQTVSSCAQCSFTQDSKYGGVKGFKAYPCVSSNFEVKTSDLTTRGGEIYTTDYCTINEVYTNGWCKVTFPMDGGGTRTAYTPISNFIKTPSATMTAYTASSYINLYSTSSLSTKIFRIYPNDACIIIGTSGSATQIFMPHTDGYYVLGWVTTSDLNYTPPTAETLNPGLTSLSSSSYAKCYTITNGRYNVYTSSSLSTRGYEGTASSTAWTGESDEIWIIGVGVNSSGTAYAKIKYPIGDSRYTAYVPLHSTLVPGSLTGSYRTAIAKVTGFSDRPGGSTNSSYWVDPGEKVYLLSQQSGYSQILYPTSGGVWRIAWCTNSMYNSMFQAQTYTISYNANGGTGAPSAQTKTRDVDLTLSSTKPTRTGYTFVGWATSSSATTAQYSAGSIYTNEASVTLYAVWRKQTFTITYNANGGANAPGAQTQTYGTAITITTQKPEKTYTVTFNANGGTVSTSYYSLDCAFASWNTNSSGTGTTVNAGSSYTPNANVTLYAKYTNPTLGNYPIPSKTGYTFDGWYTAITGGTKLNTTSVISANTTLYAHWNLETYSVIYFDDGSANIPLGQTKIYGTALTLSSASPVKDGYTFKGWATEEGSSTVVYLPGAQYTNNEWVILYAVWEKNPATLSSIAIENMPTKTTYQIGDVLDTSGLKLKLTYSDSTTESVTTGFTTSGFSSATAGTKTVTVSYGGKTTSFDVTVESAVIDENAPQITVDNKTTTAGQTVQITVVLKNNPGIAGLAVSLKYDESVLTLKDTENGGLFSGFTAAKNFAWDESTDVYEDGVLATFTFEVADNAQAGDYGIEVLIRSCTNENLDDVELSSVNGKVSVINFVYGDSNGDQKIDMKDVVLLRKYITNFDYDTNTSSVNVELGADANGDNKIDMKDVVILRKYITNYDYDTESSTVVLGPQ